MSTEQRTEIVPPGAWHTDAFRRLRTVLWGWLVVAGLGSIVLHALPLLATALLPLAVLVLPRSLLRLLPRRIALVDADPPRLELDPAGMTLAWPRGTVSRWDWDEVEALEVDRWCRGTLLGRDGRRLGQIHPAFVRPRTNWFLLPSLAVRAVELRPDLFAPLPSSNRFTQPYGFRRTMPGHHLPDMRAVRRRLLALQVLVIAVLLAAAAAAVVPLPQGLPVL